MALYVFLGVADLRLFDAACRWGVDLTGVFLFRPESGAGRPSDPFTRLAAAAAGSTAEVEAGVVLSGYSALRSDSFAGWLAAAAPGSANLFGVGAASSGLLEALRLSRSCTETYKNLSNSRKH
jgi:hypothetical protein